jgi:hypothetical protein
MQSSARVFNCARCQRQVVICSHCDRGNIYCGKRCSQSARRQSRREASRRYQRTRRGRFAHAARQRRYRQRRRAKVTHQGSPPLVPDETLPVPSRGHRPGGTKYPLGWLAMTSVVTSVGGCARIFSASRSYADARLVK